MPQDSAEEQQPYLGVAGTAGTGEAAKWRRAAIAAPAAPVWLKVQAAFGLAGA